MNVYTQNIIRLRREIEEASGGKEVILLPVTKNKSAEDILALQEAKITEIGENRVQEWQTKREKLSKHFHFHMIGQLQSNKVRAIIGDVKLIHSLDRASLAMEIQKQAEAAGRIVDVLMQVNVAGEEQKAGIAPKEVDALLALARSLPNLRLRGLMTIAPLYDSPEQTRPVFREARKIFEGMRFGPEFDILSMGMSGDFRVAVEEGSTLVRIGSAVFAG